MISGLTQEFARLGCLGQNIPTDDPVERGCRVSGVLGPDEQLLRVSDQGDWTRLGSENYCAIATIQYRFSNGAIGVRKVIAKAYVGLGLPPEKMVLQWQQRALALKSSGVAVCDVYSALDGTLYCGYVEHGLVEYLKVSTDQHTKEWAGHELAQLSDRLDDLGVHAMSLLWDLRTDGVNVHIVDFGEDLGPVPGSSTCKSRCREIMTKELAQAGLDEIIREMA